MQDWTRGYQVTPDGNSVRGSTYGLYFAGLSVEEIRATLARANAVAGQLGYISRTGPSSGRGNAAALLMAIANGEVTVMRKDQQETGQGDHTDPSTSAA